MYFYQLAFDLHSLNAISFQFCIYSQGNVDLREREEPLGLLVLPEFRECPDPRAGWSPGSERSARDAGKTRITGNYCNITGYKSLFLKFSSR